MNVRIYIGKWSGNSKCDFLYWFRVTELDIQSKGLNVITRPKEQVQRHWFVLQYVCITFHATRELILQRVCLIGMRFSSYVKRILHKCKYPCEWPWCAIQGHLWHPLSSLVIWYPQGKFYWGFATACLLLLPDFLRKQPESTLTLADLQVSWAK